MAIISGLRSKSKDKIKIEIHSEVLAKINEYCKWASIDDIGFFLEEAAQFVFTKDKDWKLTLKNQKKYMKEHA